jgi:GTPase involved in cell partitioning and DNA repair
MPASCARAQSFLSLEGAVGDARALLASQLEPVGISCTFAESGQSALLANVFNAVLKIIHYEFTN